MIDSASPSDSPPQLIAMEGSAGQKVVLLHDIALVSVLGREFNFNDDKWNLSKDISLNLALIMTRTPEQYRESVRRLLAHYATTMSGGSAVRVSVALHHFFLRLPVRLIPVSS